MECTKRERQIKDKDASREGSGIEKANEDKKKIIAMTNCIYVRTPKLGILAIP